MTDADITVYSMDEVSQHNTETDLWIVIRGNVYNVTDFLDKHPGTRKPLLYYAGKDGTAGFENIKKHAAKAGMADFMARMCIGKVETR